MNNGFGPRVGAFGLQLFQSYSSTGASTTVEEKQPKENPFLRERSLGSKECVVVLFWDCVSLAVGGIF
jgi:hypothetical protein